MSAIRTLGVTWLVLLAMLAVEATAARLLHAGPATPLIGAAMAAIVALAFMHVREGPPPIRLFVWFGGFWLLVLLALGLMDPLTRADHPAPGDAVQFR